MSFNPYTVASCEHRDDGSDVYVITRATPDGKAFRAGTVTIREGQLWWEVRDIEGNLLKVAESLDIRAAVCDFRAWRRSVTF